MAGLINLAAEYLHGLEIGSNIVQHKRQLQLDQEKLLQQGEEAQAELQQKAVAQQMVNDRERETNMARLQATTAYHEQQLALRKDRLDQFAQVNAEKTTAAARKFAANQAFAAARQSGKTVEQALYENPEASIAPAATSAARADNDVSGQRLQLSKDRLAFQQDQQAAKEGKPGKIGTIDIPIKTPGSTEWNVPIAKGIPLDSPRINELLGTNAPPGTGTNFVHAGAMPIPAAVAAPSAMPAAAASPFKEGAQIRSKKDGKLYTVRGGVPVLVDETPDDTEDN